MNARAVIETMQDWANLAQTTAALNHLSENKAISAADKASIAASIGDSGNDAIWYYNKKKNTYTYGVNGWAPRSDYTEISAGTIGTANSEVGSHSDQNTGLDSSGNGCIKGCDQSAY